MAEFGLGKVISQSSKNCGEWEQHRRQDINGRWKMLQSSASKSLLALAISFLITKREGALKTARRDH